MTAANLVTGLKFLDELITTSRLDLIVRSGLLFQMMISETMPLLRKFVHILSRFCGLLKDKIIAVTL
jgi:hypothetical protein